MILPHKDEIADKKYLLRFIVTAWKLSKYGVFSGPYFTIFGLNTEKYGPKEYLYLDNFHAVHPQTNKVRPVGSVNS